MRSPDGTAQKTLDEKGITKKQSSNWQRLADMPEEEFEAALNGPEKPTTRGVIGGKTPEPDPSKSPPVRLSDSDVRWVWGTLLDFERHNMLETPFADIFERSSPHIRRDLSRLAPSWAPGWGNASVGSPWAAVWVGSCSSGTGSRCGSPGAPERSSRQGAEAGGEAGSSAIFPARLQGPLSAPFRCHGSGCSLLS